ncbi:MAG: Polar-differentiation response regulator DivK [Pseudomonadales bacterium]|nr:Polar-differentiation response regulator DivK [Pseudomonadales bacterium]
MTRVLLVEDNEMNRDMLSRRLARKGFEVLLAIDGEQAVTLTLAERPDVVLLDMNLPLKDGWTVAREIRADQRGRQVPIIALTAHAMSDDRARALAAGCDDYETKPLDFARLLGKIAALAGARGAPPS